MRPQARYNKRDLQVAGLVGESTGLATGRSVTLGLAVGQGYAYHGVP
jgi:hypothetical protein